MCNSLLQTLIYFEQLFELACIPLEALLVLDTSAPCPDDALRRSGRNDFNAPAIRPTVLGDQWWARKRHELVRLPSVP